jgi:hypothetical protein
MFYVLVIALISHNLSSNPNNNLSSNPNNNLSSNLIPIIECEKKNETYEKSYDANHVQ